MKFSFQCWVTHESPLYKWNEQCCLLTVTSKFFGGIFLAIKKSFNFFDKNQRFMFWYTPYLYLLRLMHTHPHTRKPVWAMSLAVDDLTLHFENYSHLSAQLRQKRKSKKSFYKDWLLDSCLLFLLCHLLVSSLMIHYHWFIIIGLQNCHINALL